MLQFIVTCSHENGFMNTIQHRSANRARALRSAAQGPVGFTRSARARAAQQMAPEALPPPLPLSAPASSPPFPQMFPPSVRTKWRIKFRKLATSCWRKRQRGLTGGQW